jgi:hypothetical protein
MLFFVLENWFDLLVGCLDLTPCFVTIYMFVTLFVPYAATAIALLCLSFCSCAPCVAFSFVLLCP